MYGEVPGVNTFSPEDINRMRSHAQDVNGMGMQPEALPYRDLDLNPGIPPVGSTEQLLDMPKERPRGRESRLGGRLLYQ